jgi:hypothetical protein
MIVHNTGNYFEYILLLFVVIFWWENALIMQNKYAFYCYCEIKNKLHVYIKYYVETGNVAFVVMLFVISNVGDIFMYISINWCKKNST